MEANKAFKSAVIGNHEYRLVRPDHLRPTSDSDECVQYHGCHAYTSSVDSV